MGIRKGFIYFRKSKKKSGLVHQGGRGFSQTRLLGRSPLWPFFDPFWALYDLFRGFVLFKGLVQGPKMCFKIKNLLFLVFGLCWS